VAEHDGLTLARLLAADGAPGEALALLDRLADAAAAAGRGRSLVEIRIVRALAHRAAGDPAAAVRALAVALAEAVPAGYRRLVLDEGPPIEELLRAVARTGADDVRPLASDLLATARPSAPAPGRATAAHDLSARELEVLRLLATELTGPEIASSLYVSVNTLRTHTKHVFAKLDVNSRRAAVRRAVELGLL
jgi:LuxR family maltose regulon positive regulatory protein